MSVTIAFSNTSDDIWIIRNAVFRWLVTCVEQLHPDDSDVVERLAVSGHLGGISLVDELSESRTFTIRIVTALLATIDEILTRPIPLTDDQGSPWPELQPQVYQALAELRAMLLRFDIDSAP